MAMTQAQINAEILRKAAAGEQLKDKSNAANNAMYAQAVKDNAAKAAAAAAKPPSSGSGITNTGTANSGSSSSSGSGATGYIPGGSNTLPGSYGGSFNGLPGLGTVTSPNVAQPDPSQSGGLTAEEVQQMMMEFQKQQMAQQNNGMQDMLNEYMRQAAEAAKQQNLSMQNQYNSLLDQYQTGQTNDLSALDRSYEDGKGQLEDQSFQQYLQARQSMANRGIAGSGLANDQDTRLLMANSKNLAGLNNNLLTQKASTTQRYGSLMDNIRNQLAALKASYQ